MPEVAVTSTPLSFQWLDAFEMGNAEINDLHRTLFEDCRELVQLVEDNAAWPLIVAKAWFLVEDCVRHFRVEAIVLNRTRFPRYAEHVAQHRKIEEELGALLARMASVDGSQAEHRELPRCFGPLLVDVMLRLDLDYRSHLLHKDGL
jgi:hemerythrin-like metal-binding protein